MAVNGYHTYYYRAICSDSNVGGSRVWWEDEGGDVGEQKVESPSWYFGMWVGLAGV